MGKTTNTRREGLACEAVEPRSGKRMVVIISQQKLLSLIQRSEGQVKEAAFTVPIILKKPRAVFRGLMRDGDEPRAKGEEGWLCYCGIPDVAYNADGSERAPWPNEVFLVFVSGEKVVYNWYWSPCDSQNHELPDGFLERFKERAL